MRTVLSRRDCAPGRLTRKDSACGCLIFGTSRVLVASFSFSGEYMTLAGLIVGISMPTLLLSSRSVSSTSESLRSWELNLCFDASTRVRPLILMQFCLL